MPSLSELSAISGIPCRKLEILREYGLEIYEEDFEIDRDHQKALLELSRKRLTPFVLAYCLYWRENNRLENHSRYDNIVSIAEWRGLPIRGELHFLQPRQISEDSLPTAKHWIDRAVGISMDSPALERIGKWALMVICNGPEGKISYNYLAVRLLLSLPYEEMSNYPTHVHRALNKVKHYGHLDGCHRVSPGIDGKNMTFYFRPKYDL